MTIVVASIGGIAVIISSLVANIITHIVNDGRKVAPPVTGVDLPEEHR